MGRRQKVWHSAVIMMRWVDLAASLQHLRARDNAGSGCLKLRFNGRCQGAISACCAQAEKRCSSEL